MPSDAVWGGGVKHALLNEYTPGEGLRRHRDDLSFWTGWVLGLSLGSGVTMRFSPSMRGQPNDAEAVDLYLPARSVYIMTDDARCVVRSACSTRRGLIGKADSIDADRYTWSHEIEARATDTVDGVEVPRGHRSSMTLRGICAKWLPEA